MTLVSIDAHTGTLQRYETCPGVMPRVTHACTLDEPYGFDAKTVEQFRIYPDPRFAIEAPTPPRNPPGRRAQIHIAA